MSNQEHYKEVLKDLEGKLEGVVQELSKIKQEIGFLIDCMKHRAAAHGSYAGLSILEASKAFLTTHGKPASVQEITEAIISGGIESKAADPKSTCTVSRVYGVLHRDCVNNNGVIEKTGSGMWYLPTWCTGEDESRSVNRTEELIQYRIEVDTDAPDIADELTQGETQ